MLIRCIINKAYSNKYTSISSQNHAQRNRLNKTRYDELGKPMKQEYLQKYADYI